MRLLLIAVLLAATASAQDTRGQIFGSVTDSSGAAIAGVSVRCVNINTGVEASAATNERGEYIVPLLLPGMYRVTIEQPGFKRFVKDRVEVRVTERIPVAATLELGQVTETVEVEASATLLETASASMGQVIDNRRIAELPLKDGNPIMTVGAAGGPKITTQVLLAIIRVLDFDQSLRDAVSNRRFHHQWRPNAIVYERGLDAEIAEGLIERGHNIEVIDGGGGRTQAIALGDDGKLIGVADPRGRGTAAGE